MEKSSASPPLSSPAFLPFKDEESSSEPLGRSINLSWDNLSFMVAKKEQPIVSGLSGTISSGSMLAVMGPSGAGKSTLLDLLCQRKSPATGQVLLNGSTHFSTRDHFSFVEQDDALLGVLTVVETVTFAARLSLPPNTANIEGHVQDTLRSLGLQDCAEQRIGNPIQRGISGGQKRRVTIACAVVAKPRVLSDGDFFLAQEHLDGYLGELGFPTPLHVNPCDHAMALVNTEFYTDATGRTPREHLDHLAATWQQHSSSRAPLSPQTPHNETPKAVGFLRSISEGTRKTWILSYRNTLNYSRNLLAYGVRMGMYVGMGLLLALVWIRLGTSTNKINDRFSVHFFSVAFLGFMSVSGIPAFLEERAVFVRERANGLYGPGAYLIASTITSIPFLFACTLLFALICYWAIGLHPGATHFFRFLAYLFLGIFAAGMDLSPSGVPETGAHRRHGLQKASRFSSLPSFRSLSRRWPSPVSPTGFGWSFKDDYQTFAFELLVKNDVQGLIFHCPVVNDSCICPIPSSLVSSGQCAVTGNDILDNLGISGINSGLYVGILIIIILVFRLMMYGVLVVRKT
ncbi:ABC transporter [Pseudohyphozyma bogoriensis]|nr:ABC transporter [Pseudohyphozyma bogoriensis]